MTSLSFQISSGTLNRRTNGDRSTFRRSMFFIACERSKKPLILLLRVPESLHKISPRGKNKDGGDPRGGAVLTTLPLWYGVVAHTTEEQVINYTKAFLFFYKILNKKQIEMRNVKPKQIETQSFNYCNIMLWLLVVTKK